MVGIVIVSHSQKLAEGVAELAGMMAKGVDIAAAGGLEDGELGTSFARIEAGIESVNGEDGVVVLADMGSAFLTAELAADAQAGGRVRLANAPLVEGAVLAAVTAAGGATLDEVFHKAESAACWDKRALGA